MFHGPVAASPVGAGRGLWKIPIFLWLMVWLIFSSFSASCLYQREVLIVNSN